MKIPFKQNTKSGCGSYCLANLFNDSRYLHGVEEMEFGEGVAQLNKKLAFCNPEIYLEAVYNSPSEMVKQSNKLIDPLVFMMIWAKVDPIHKENYCRPFIISVKMASGRFHAILLLHDLKNNVYHIVDSLCDIVQIVDLDGLMGLYSIHAVEYFCSWNINEDDKSVLIKKDFINHLITNEQ